MKTDGNKIKFLFEVARSGNESSKKRKKPWGANFESPPPGLNFYLV